MTDTRLSQSGRVPLSELDAETEGVPYTISEVCHEFHDIIIHMDEPEVLELACGYGKATPYLASAAAVTGGHVYAVDHKPRKWEGDTVRDRLQRMDLLKNCSLTIGQDARWYIFDLLQTDSRKWIDFVYFDLSHTLEVDAFVALAAWNHLRPGGVMIFDDLDWIPAEHGSSNLETERPDIKQIEELFEYMSERPEVGQHGTWGQDNFNWTWGILRKEPCSTEANEDLKKKVDELIE